jgi:cholesterol transport system auxiliary component
MRRARRRALLALLGLAATGCSLQPVDVEPRRHTLSKLPEDIAAAASLPFALVVPLPDGDAAYDTPRMAYRERANELAYYARNEWAERPPTMLHALLLRSLGRTRRFRAVVAPPYGERGAWALRTRLLELLQDFTVEPPVARLALRAELRDAGDRAVAARDFEVAMPMGARSPEGGAAAANEAAARLLADVARFVVDATVNAARQATSCAACRRA